MSILVHYGELALKGKNRRPFENKLIENIKKAGGGSVRRLEGRFFIEDGNLESLKKVFGISWLAPAYRVEKNLQSIKEVVLREVRGRIDGSPNTLPSFDCAQDRLDSYPRSQENPTFGVFVKRVDKGFPYTSSEVGKIIGGEVAKEYKLKVRLKSPEIPVYVEIADEVFVFFEKIPGLGGLPVGVNGRVLCLLSGGIDSPVASYLIMKRGCRVDFIHFHVFPGNKAVFQTKIRDLVLALNRYQFESRIFLAPYKLFNLALIRKDISRGYELILFRRFMVKVAERIAKNWGCQALITGDSLGQVASQTLENLNAFNEAASLPVLQPLISFDKEGIIDLARKIGTYGVSIKPYKDCCSIVASSPKTKARPERIKAFEEKMDIEKVINETTELVKVYEL